MTDSGNVVHLPAPPATRRVMAAHLVEFTVPAAPGADANAFRLAAEWFEGEGSGAALLAVRWDYSDERDVYDLTLVVQAFHAGDLDRLARDSVVNGPEVLP